MAVSESLLLGHLVESSELLYRPVFFDWQLGPPADDLPLLGLNLHSSHSLGTYVAAVLADNLEALVKMEHRGLLPYMPEGWHANPGPSLDNLGASGDPRVGVTLALINESALLKKLEEALQQAITHENQGRIVVQGGNLNFAQTRTVLRCSFSTVGATGNGSVYWLLHRGARKCAKAQGVQIKVVLDGLIRGTLPTDKDVNQANMNELVCLTHLRALATSHYVDPVTGRLMRCPFDFVVLSSNQNNKGSIAALDPLLCHEALANVHFWHHPAGNKMRERLSDHENWPYDEYGDPGFVFTRSCAIISRDSSRKVDYCSHQVGAFLAEALQAQGDPDQVRKQTVAFARLHEIVESDQESQITGSLLRPDELDHESLLERSARSLADRVGNTRGIRRAQAAAEAVNDMRNADVETTDRPLMRRQAEAKLKATIDGLEEFLDRCMHRLPGFWEAHQFCAFLKVIAESSQQALMIKIHALQELLHPYEDVLAEATEQLQQLQELSLPGRMYNTMLIRGIASCLYDCGQAAIGCQLQIAACTVAAQDVLTPFIEYLDQKLVWLSPANQRLHQIGETLRQKATSLAEQPTSSRIPLGFELVTAKRLEDYLEDYLEQAGGEDNLAEQLFVKLLTRTGTLAALLEASTEECQECFVSICADAFTPLVATTDVVTEFKRLYPDQAGQEKLMEQANLHSEGRLPIIGEVNEPVVWLKIVSVPSPDYADWARGILEKVDKKHGKWEVVVHSNRDQITLLQLRGGISLTPMIKRLEPPDTAAHWAQIVRKSPDPVSALAVGPNPNPRQFKRVLAKAIATEQLTVGDDGYFAVNLLTGEPLVLGKDLPSVTQKLQPNWSSLIFIESTFGRDLVVDPEKITARLDQIRKHVESGANDMDPRLSLIDITAVEEAITHAELILPWAKRIQKANLEGLSE
jgi:hypothetical protein